MAYKSESFGDQLRGFLVTLTGGNGTRGNNDLIDMASRIGHLEEGDIDMGQVSRGDQVASLLHGLTDGLLSNNEPQINRSRVQTRQDINDERVRGTEGYSGFGEMLRKQGEHGEYRIPRPRRLYGELHDKVNHLPGDREALGDPRTWPVGGMGREMAVDAIRSGSRLWEQPEKTNGSSVSFQGDRLSEYDMTPRRLGRDYYEHHPLARSLLAKTPEGKELLTEMGL